MLIPKPKQKPLRKFFFECAERLLKIIKSSGRRPGRYDAVQWADLISKLETKGIPDQSVADALDFLDGNKDQFCPIVQSARAFVEKFPRIIEARSRAAGQQSKIQKVTIGKAAIEIFEMNGCSFPDCLEGDRSELEFIQRTITNYERFLSDLELAERTFAEASAVPAAASRDEWMGLCSYLLRSFQAEPQEFARYWLGEMSSMAWRLQKRNLWLGNPLKFVWHPKSKRWERFARECVVEYLGDEKCWDILLAYMASLR